ncbi:MAG: hypothetical protein RIS76_4463 [Verrucomicrobiota bacterium]
MTGSVQRAHAAPGPSRALWGIIRFLGRRPGWVALSIGLLLVNISIELYLPQIPGNVITALGHSPQPSDFSLLTPVLLFLGLVVVRALIGLLLGPIRNRTAQRTLGDIRSAVYDALQRRTFAWHDNARTGELISRAGTDVGRLQELMFVCLLFSVDVVAGLLGTLALIFALSPLLGGLTLAALLPTVGAMAFFAARLQPRWRRVHDRHGAMSTVIQENIAGVRVVKAFARESAQVERFRVRKDAYLVELLDAVNYWAARVPFAQLLFGLGVPLILWAGGRQVIAGSMPLGDLAKAVFYLLGLGGRIGVIGQITNILQNASSAAQRIHEILEAPVESSPSSRSSADGDPVPRGGIRFEGVSFRYDNTPSLRVLREDGSSAAPEPPRLGRALALEGVSFEITPGQTIAVVGSTGSGKSTLLAMIPRLYDPQSGTVRVDGADVRDCPPAVLRRRMAIVFQETFLFSASVAENIAFGRPDASREEVVRVAVAARADGFIRELSEGYDTIIGERGVSLSGGQRQRLALARALLMDPQILLLDDAMSAVDPATEREMREGLSATGRRRTTLVVSQRLSAVRRADRILVLQEGRLVEHGSHAELISRGGVYAALFQSQLQDPEIPG